MQQSYASTLFSRFQSYWLGLLLLLGSAVSQAQTPDWTAASMLSATPHNGSGSTGGSATDAAGNLYVTGIYFGSLGFGSTTLTTIDARGEGYVAKLSPTGQWLWAVRVALNSGATTGTDSVVRPTGLAVDATGSTITLTGTLLGAASFGTTTLTSGGTSGTSDVFVARLETATRQWQWAVQAGSTGNDTGRGVAVDAAGNAVITCLGRNNTSFGTIVVPGSTTGIGFIAKLSPTGQWLWALYAGFSDVITVPVVEAGTGTITVAGVLGGRTVFDSITVPANAGAVFVGQLSAAGQWTQVRGGGLGSSTAYEVTALAVDAAGNALVAGAYYNGPAQFGTYTLPSTNRNNIFVAKLSTSGQWTWARGAGGIGQDVAQALAVDAVGNAYCTGYFSDDATFGTQVLLNPNPASLGAPRQTFVGRLAAATGQWEWAVAGNSLGGSYDFGYTLVVDPGGRVYFGGGVINNYTVGTTTVYAANFGVPYQAQLNGNTGTLNWLATPEGQGPRTITAMATDAAGNLLVGGTFFGTLTLGSTTLQRDLTHSGFLAKRTPTGQWLWAVAVGGSVNGLAVMPNTGDVVLTGEFSAARGGGFGNITLTSPYTTSYNDIYVARITAAGQWQWVTQAGGPDTDRSFAVSVNAAGLVTVAGSYFNGATFGTLTPVGPANNGSSDGFVAQLSSIGQWQWHRRLSGQITEITHSLATTPNGGTLVAGHFQSPSLSFGGPGGRIIGTRGPTSGAIALICDGFLAKIDAAGTWEWATGMGGNQYDETTAVVSDAQGNAYVTGFYDSSTASFGSAPSTLALNNAASGSPDGFVAKYSATGQVVWATRASSSGSEELSALTQDDTGNLYVGGLFTGSASAYGSTVLSAAGLSDAVVGKLNANGQWLWARRAGGVAQDLVTAMAFDHTTGALHVGGATVSRQLSFSLLPLAAPSELYDSAFLSTIGSAGPLTPLATMSGSTSSALGCFPNPAYGIVQLTLPPNAAEAHVFDAVGRIIRTVKAISSIAYLDVTSLPTGIYLVRAGGQTHRLVIE